MKKYLLVILLLVFIIPSVASASWWNPFSWKIFHKKEPAPQVQVETQKTSEEKIKDLEKELNDLKNEKSDSTSIKKTPVVTNKQNAPKTNPTNKENLNEYPASMLLFYFNSVYANIEYLGKVISSIETRIKWTTERKNFLENNNKYNDKAIDILIKFDEDSLKKYDEYLVFFKKMIVYENEDLSWARETENYLKQRVYKNREEAVKDAEKISKHFDEHSEKDEVISKQAIIIRELYESNEAKFLEMLDIYSSYLEANKPASNFYIPSSYRQPAVIPQIQIPKTTYCTMGSMAGTLSHYTITCN